MNLIKFWNNIAISKKLYTVFGVMAMLIAVELAALSLSMDTLSAVRAFVGGEGLWSKAQKDAVNSLQKYVITEEHTYYYEFWEYLRVPLGDRQARLQLETDSPDMDRVYAGFLQGGVHVDDVERMVNLLTRFSWTPFIQDATGIWREGDRVLDTLMDLARDVSARMDKGTLSKKERHDLVSEIDAINIRLTQLEIAFSSVLAAGSRQVEQILWITLLILVLTVETTGLTFTYFFGRHLTRGLKEINGVAQRIGNGIFDRKSPVRSKDELGQLAKSMNRIVDNIEENIGRRQQAEEVSKVKTLFLANMSHEIRTPLSAIIGFSELLQDPNLTDVQRAQYVEIIQKTGHNLTNIINDILDISKIESGHLSIQKEDLSLTDLLGDLEQLLRLKCREKAIGLKFSTAPNLPSRIHIDPSRLRQVLINILSNAIKFTDTGYVNLHASLKSGLLTFDVQDTGAGISKRHQNRIFEPFHQGDASHARKHGGTGLGLPLSRHLAQMMGGDIVLVDSKKGQGTHFRITVDFEPPRGANVVTPKQFRKRGPGSAAGNYNLQDLHVLVVDDSEDNRLLVKVILERWGCQVDYATDGIDAVRAALDQPYDIVLMDIQMPKLDGYRATEMLRKKGFSKPIIALTAHAMKEDRERCLEAGCNDVLTKPINTAELVKMISEYHEHRSKAHLATEVPSET